MSDVTKFSTDLQAALDNAREEGCSLCSSPMPTDTFVIRVMAVHAECLMKPEPEDEPNMENVH